MGKKLIEKFSLNFQSVTNLDTDDPTSLRIDKSRYEDNAKTEGIYNINAGPAKKGVFNDISFRLRDDGINSNGLNFRLTTPDLNEKNPIPKKESPELLSPNLIPEKEGVDVDPLTDAEISGRLEADARDIEQNYKKPINYNSQTPEIENFDNSNKLKNTGKDKIIPNETPEKQGIELQEQNVIPEKQGIELQEQNVIPEKIATSDLSSYEPINFEEIDNLSPEYNNDKINPFENIDKLDTMESEFNDISTPVDFLDNAHAPGFISNFEGPTKYVEDSSEFDPPSPNQVYSIENRYMDVLDSKENGIFPEIRDDLINDASNPYAVTDTHGNLGSMGTHINQEVDFQNNSIGGWTHIERPDINHHMNIGQDLGILSQTQFNVDGVFMIDGEPIRYVQDDGSIAPNATNTFPLLNFEGRTYDPRTVVPEGSEISNVNDYTGTKSIIRAWQLSPFASDVGMAQYASDTGGAPSPEFVFDYGSDNLDFSANPPSKLYDLVAYDPRLERTDYWGHTTIIKKNNYNGSIFDDGFLVDNIPLDGGGLFNSSTNKYVANSGYREVPSTTARDIAFSGNWANSSVFNMEGAGLGYNSVSASINRYEESSGTGTLYNISGSTHGISRYLGWSKFLNTGDGLGNLSDDISLVNGSWYFGTQIPSRTPMTNEYQDPYSNGLYNHTSASRSNTLWYPSAEDHNDGGIPGQLTLSSGLMGDGDLISDSIFNTIDVDGSMQISHISGSMLDSRLSVHYGGIKTMGSGSRGLEPYESFDIQNANDPRFNAMDSQMTWESRTKKFLQTPKGIKFRNKQQKLWDESPTGGQGANVANWENFLTDSEGSPTADGENPAINYGHNTATDGVVDTGYTKYYSSIGVPSKGKFLGMDMDAETLPQKPFGSIVGKQDVPLDGAYIPMFGDDNWAEQLVNQGLRLAVAGIDRALKKKGQKDAGNKDADGKPRGDFSTLLPMQNGNSMFAAFPMNFRDIESQRNFMPFYFRDMRDKSWIFFRGYLSNMTETMASQWTEETPLGRSESVHIYQKGTRDISLTFELMANTRDELDMIYAKLNKLQTFVYPEYKRDVSFTDLGKFTWWGGYENDTVSKLRAKPPLVKLRIGELFGKSGNEVMGFVMSLNLSYPNGSTWETSPGSRVPKQVTVTMQYKVLHESVPDINTQFHGKQTAGGALVNFIKGLASSGGQNVMNWGSKHGSAGFGGGWQDTTDSVFNVMGTAASVADDLTNYMNDYKNPSIPPKGEEV